MPKSVKLEPEVYDRLERFRDKRETFSQAIDRLLTLLEKVGELRNILEGGANFQQQKQAEIDAITKARAEREDLEACTIKTSEGG